MNGDRLLFTAYIAGFVALLVASVGLLITAYIAGFVALLVASVRLVRRSEPRLDGGQFPASPRASEIGAGDAVAAYLDRMSGVLRLPAGDVAEVRAELSDHLADSIASLEAEGLDRERATREALARLGSADELGRHLRHAHQSTRRLLAGVGGGVVAGTGGVLLGYLGAMAVTVAVALVLGLAVALLTALLTAIGVPFPDLTYDRTEMIAGSLAIAAGTGTRFAIRTSAGLSRRTPRSMAVPWAIALGIGFSCLAVFGIRGPQGWPDVIVELCIPVVAVAAATVQIDRPMPHVGRWGVAIVVISVIGIGFLFGAVGSASPMWVQTDDAWYMHADIAGPMAPSAWLPETGLSSRIGESGDGATQARCVLNTTTTPIATALANWHDIRGEAWHGTLGLESLDTHYSSPFAIEPADIQNDAIVASFHFDLMRHAGAYWLFLTGVGPDGRRYVLSQGGGGVASFYGSVWDWLTATQDWLTATQ